MGEECCTCCVGLPIYHKGGCLLTQCDMTTLLMDVVFDMYSAVVGEECLVAGYVAEVTVH